MKNSVERAYHYAIRSSLNVDNCVFLIFKFNYYIRELKLFFFFIVERYLTPYSFTLPLTLLFTPYPFTLPFTLFLTPYFMPYSLPHLTP